MIPRDIKLSPANLPAPVAEEGTSLWKDAWYRLRRNTAALAGLVLFSLIALSCLTSLPIRLWEREDGSRAAIPGWYPFSPYEQMLSLGATAPFERIAQAEDVDSGRAPRLVSLERLATSTTERVRDGRRPRLITDEERAALLEALGRGDEIRIADTVYRPSRRIHILGTDQLGRDMFARLMEGGRVSLGVGFAATLVSILIGVLYGSIAAYRGGKTDAVMMRLVDILYSMPFTIFVIVLMTVLDTRSLLLLFIAIGCVEWLTMARIVRGQVMSIKRMEFIEAAHALGLGNRRIILRHIIPNVLGPVIVFATLTVPAVMLLEAALSFLGLGVQPPTASWGVLIKEGAESMQVHPWLLLFPAGLFSLTLFCLNFLGDGLRDALDVKASKD
jgi:oligopeptide transport system permease protein